MSQQLSLDMATALDIKLPCEQEAKFQALKNLQLMKTKALMTQLAGKDKEIARITALGKDNRRTQMIEALKLKIRDFELVTDVVKSQLCSKAGMTIDEVNEFIVKKTISGPKRFRPLSREEMELRIAELERSSKRGAGTPATLASDAKSIVSNGGGATAKASPRPSTARVSPRPSTGLASEAKNQTSGTIEDLSKIAQLVHEVDSLKKSFAVAQGTIERQKEEISRLRSRNAELCMLEEETDFHETQFKELQQRYDMVSEELTDTTRKLAATMEENMQLHAKTMFDQEQVEVERDAVHDQCERLLRQNTSLLQRMASMELEMEEKIDVVKAVNTKSAADQSSAQAKNAAVTTLEQKLVKLQTKLKASEENCAALSKEVTQIQTLKDTIRDKNTRIRDLERQIESRNKAKAASVASASALDGADELTALKAENKRLVSALQLAAAESVTAAAAPPKKLHGADYGGAGSKGGGGRGGGDDK